MSNRTSTQPLRVGDYIEYCDKKGQNQIVKILSRAGKATGKYKLCYNVQNKSGALDNVDLARDVNNWKKLDSDEEAFSVEVPDAIYQAKIEELKNWRSNGVY